MVSLAAAPDDWRLGEGGDAEAGRDPQDAGRGQLGLRHPGLGTDVLVPEREKAKNGLMIYDIFQIFSQKKLQKIQISRLKSHKIHVWLFFTCHA